MPPFLSSSFQSFRGRDQRHAGGDHLLDRIVAPQAAVVGGGMGEDVDAVVHGDHHAFCIGGMGKDGSAEAVCGLRDRANDVFGHIDDLIARGRPGPDLDSIGPRVDPLTDVGDGLLWIGGFGEFERSDIKGASIRGYQRNAGGVDDRAVDIAFLYPVADTQDVPDGEFGDILDVDETMAGDHLFHLPVELGSGHEVGVLPFGFDKMDVAIPESSGKCEVLTVDNGPGGGNVDPSTEPTAVILPLWIRTVPSSMGAAVGKHKSWRRPMPGWNGWYADHIRG